MAGLVVVGSLNMDLVVRAPHIPIPNETELALVTGLPLDSLKRIGDAARTLLARRVGSVVVTLGGRGALTVGQDQPAMHVPAFADEVVDSTAAGDSFVGAFSVALAIVSIPLSIAGGYLGLEIGRACGRPGSRLLVWCGAAVGGIAGYVLGSLVAFSVIHLVE